ncbi:MAG: hypothetical protein CVU63_14835 [Deltaproteobacteria bacterium HGW-Deltaproteobacteria-20]|nr:MAG: hypothetical protein CVU63_14835 [Deltaproteobacteria bacterium HGW-Deltaproteobacteria-20]
MSDFSPYSCPRCAGRMQVGRAPDAVLHACGRCGGIWIDNGGEPEVTVNLLGPCVARDPCVLPPHQSPNPSVPSAPSVVF